MSSSVNLIAARLVAEACQFYGVPEDHVMTSRRGYVTYVRRAVGHVLMETVGWNVPAVARFFKKDPKAISGGEAEALIALRNDPLFFEIVSRLTRLVVPE